MPEPRQSNAVIAVVDDDPSVPQGLELQEVIAPSSNLPLPGERARPRERCRNRIVIRSADFIVHPALRIGSIGNKGPIDRACEMRQAGCSRGRMAGQSHCVVAAGVAQSPSRTARARV